MGRWIRRRTRIALYLRDGRACVYCGTTWAQGVLTLDHIVPRSQDGSNGWTNLVTCCWTCNSKRRDEGLQFVAREQGLSVRELRARIRKHTRRSRKKYEKIADLHLDRNKQWIAFQAEIGARQGIASRFPGRGQLQMFTHFVGSVPYSEVQCGWCSSMCEGCLEAYLEAPTPEDPPRELR